MAEKKLKKYIVVTALDCEGLKDKPHLKAGDSVPGGLDPKDIQALLASGDIKESE